MKLMEFWPEMWSSPGWSLTTNGGFEKVLILWMLQRSFLVNYLWRWVLLMEVILCIFCSLFTSFFLSFSPFRKQMSVLKHEKDILVNSEKRALDEVRSLSERVHRLQVAVLLCIESFSFMCDMLIVFCYVGKFGHHSKRRGSSWGTCSFLIHFWLFICLVFSTYISPR